MIKDNLFLIVSIILYAAFALVFLVVFKVNNRTNKGVKLWVVGSIIQIVASIYFIFGNYLEFGFLRSSLAFIFNILLISSMYITIGSTLTLMGVKTNKKVLRIITVASIAVITYATIIKFNRDLIALHYIIILPLKQLSYIFFANYKRTRQQKSRWFAYSFIQVVFIILFITYILEKLLITKFSFGDIIFVESTNALLQGIIILGIANALGLTTAVNNYMPRFIDIEENIFMQIFKDSPNMIIMFDLSTYKIKFYNNIFIKTFKYRKSVILDKMDLTTLFNNKDEYNNLINSISKENNFTVSNVELKTKDNQIIYTTFSATPFLLQDGYYFIVNIVDITEEVLKQQMYHKLASFDELTKLPNRRNLYIRFAQKAASNERFKVLLLDLDHFKKINDVYGHSKGDDALIIISQRLMAFNDNNNLVARLGGDEFALLLDYHSDYAKSKLEELTNIFKQPITINDKQINVTISAGVARYPEDGNDIKDLIDKADIALYEAKKYETSKILRYQELNNNK